MTDRFDVIVLGVGSGAEALAGVLADSDLTAAFVEEHRVGGECPFTACMPSKVMLHDAAVGRSWEDSVTRRDEVVGHRDDTPHAEALRDQGHALVRGRGRLAGRGAVEVTVRGGGVCTLEADHVVIATGGAARRLEVPGIDEATVWTSDDAWTAYDRPDRLLVVGAGAVALEAATAFRRFGSQVHLTDRNEQFQHRLPPPIGDTLAHHLDLLGVRRHQAAEVASCRRTADGATTVTLTTGEQVTVDVLMLGIGKVPRIADVGLDTVGLETAQWRVGTDGRVDGVAGLWAVGDVTEHPQFTHSANALAELVAQNILDGEDRRLDVSATPMCVFTDPPLAQVGQLPDDEDHLTVTATYGDIARPTTDEAGQGTVALTARRADGEVVGIAGVGARLDEVSAAWVMARHARYDVARLARVMQQFPTYGEVTRLLATRARDELRRG